MAHDWKMEVYWRLPVRLQEASLSLYARYLDKIYYGPLYKEWKERIEGWKSWSRSSIEEWENQRLQCIAELAAKHIPYYRDKWKKISWRNVGSKADLHLLPILEKQSIRQKEHDFIADNLNPRSLWVEKTSGTTGTSLRIYWPIEVVQKLWAIDEVMIRHVAGVSQEIPRAMMGGRPIVKGDINNPPYWRYNHQWKQLYFSSYHVSKRTAHDYVGALRKYGSQWITGYGSAIAALAEFALEAGIEPYHVRSVIVSGDTLLHGMRQSIEKFFQCKCFDQYGQCEGVAMAMECPYHRMHITPLVGIIEILREDRSLCNRGEVGEIIATGLLNDAMPLIRYRTGDYAAWAEEQDCPCGNPNPIITNLEGRVDDYLITSDGRRIGRLSTAMKRTPTIHSAQIVQDRPGHAYLLVRPGEGYRSSHALEVHDDIIEKIGKFELEIIEVPEIPKTLQGKTVLVVRLDERPTMRDTYEQFF